MTSRSRRRSRRRITTGAGRRSRQSRAGGGLVAHISQGRLSSGHGLSLLLGALSRNPRRRSTSTSRRSRRRLSGSANPWRRSSPISVVRQMPFSSGLDALLPPGFRKFFFLGDTPTRSTTSGSSYSEQYSINRASEGPANTLTWMPPPGATFSGPHIPSTPSRETSA